MKNYWQTAGSWRDYRQEKREVWTEGLTAEAKTDIESDTDTFRDQDIYCECVCVCVCVCVSQRRGGGGGGTDMMMVMMRERSGAGAVMVCPTSDRQSVALFNALQISPPCALWTPTAHQRSSHRCRADWGSGCRLNEEEAEIGIRACSVWFLPAEETDSFEEICVFIYRFLEIDKDRTWVR